MPNKKDALFKFCMAVAAALFMVALYFNNQLAIDRISSAKRVAESDRVMELTSDEIDDRSMELSSDDMDDRAMEFSLYDAGGNEKKLSDFRGNVVFMTFWSPQSSESIECLNVINDSLGKRVGDSGGGYKVSLISVNITNDGNEEEGQLFDDGSFFRFYDGDSKLARLFSVNDFPTTYIFYPNGELCDYKYGALDAEYIDKMYERASKGV